MGSEYVSDLCMYIIINCNCSSFFNLLTYTCIDILFLLVEVNWFHSKLGKANVK